MVRVAALVALFLALAVPAAAHLTPNSEIRLDFGRGVVVADIVIPLGELGYALGRPVAPRVGPAPPGLGAYVLRGMSVRSPDGRPWALALREARIAAEQGGPDLLARVEIRPPAGAPLRRFDLAYSAVIDRVENHLVLVAVRTDYGGGQLSDQPRLLGGLQGPSRVIRVDRGPESAWRGFLAAIGLGMRHIAEGHDHLLFLLALLLPAPLLARERRWREFGGFGFTARRLIAVVTAFTVGHSITLVGGAVLSWRLPAQPVEVLISVSILVSAAHAARPLFAGREAFIAAGFGLVHGMAFATLIGRFGLDPWQKAQSILGFNLGIEMVQLAVVAAVTPFLAVLAQTRSYPAVRAAAAAFCAVAAISWIVERVLGAENLVGRAIDTGLAYATWLLLALAAGTGLAVLADRRRDRRAAV